MELAKIIRKMRGEKTQEQFARELDCSRLSIINWESGRFMPSQFWLDKLGIKVIFRAVPRKESE